MSFSKPKAIIIDIEGTTTDKAFISKVLFPFIKNNLIRFFIETYEEADTKAIILRLRNAQKAKPMGPIIADSGRDAICKSVTDLIVWQIERKMKTSELKQIQIMCWFWGYKNKLIKSHIYADVPISLHKWKNKYNIKICTFSSGLSIAQQLMFCNTSHGNIHSLIDQFFDNSIGDKKQSKTYEMIAKSVGVEERQILFITDDDREAKAAVGAGLKAALIKRKGEKSLTNVPEAPIIRSFEDLNFD